MGKAVESVAEQLVREHAEGTRFHPFAAAAGIADLDGAYAVQRAYVRLQRQNRGVAPVGYKIGLTSARMQAMCRIDSPIAGVILGDRAHRSGARLRAADYGRLGVEFEIAVRLGRDFPVAGETVALAEVAAAVDAVCPAMELVDDRDCDYGTLDVLSLVADNSWNAGVVLGEFRASWPELSAVEGLVSLDGAAADRGFGRDVLGHPFHSVAWLATHLAKTGEQLKAGDLVMTGSLVTTKFPTVSSSYRFDVAGLGAVEAAVTV